MKNLATFRILFHFSNTSDGTKVGFMLFGFDQQSSAKSKASLQFRLDQHL